MGARLQIWSECSLSPAALFTVTLDDGWRGHAMSELFTLPQAVSGVMLLKNDCTDRKLLLHKVTLKS